MSKEGFQRHSRSTCFPIDEAEGGGVQRGFGVLLCQERSRTYLIKRYVARKSQPVRQLWENPETTIPTCRRIL